MKKIIPDAKKKLFREKLQEGYDFYKACKKAGIDPKVVGHDNKQRSNACKTRKQEKRKEEEVPENKNTGEQLNLFGLPEVKRKRKRSRKTQLHPN